IGRVRAGELVVEGEEAVLVLGDVAEVGHGGGDLDGVVAVGGDGEGRRALGVFGGGDGDGLLGVPVGGAEVERGARGDADVGGAPGVGGGDLDVVGELGGEADSEVDGFAG